MRARTLLLSAVFPFLGVACSTPDDGAPAPESASGVAAATSADVGDAHEAIDAAMARYIDAVKRGDTTAIVASLADDPVAVFPTGPARKGKAEVSKAFAEMFSASSVKELKPARADLTVSGDLAVETGTFEITMQPRAGDKEMTDKGQYIVVWQRQRDGSWKILRGFNRSDAPVGPGQRT
jgi:uncharacterized protein (TIGR02246 family)